LKAANTILLLIEEFYCSELYIDKNNAAQIIFVRHFNLEKICPMKSDLSNFK
tara:strand:+ start:1641 stop:1796 length:156 start_codon:yes stop_codon:yes gene_type:complete